jgi:CRISPR/Cas system CSM-associated protein Csm3 (group 7 of RAMP superfamily)
MARPNLPSEPNKPFFTIPLKGSPQRGKPSAHDHFEAWSGRLEVEVEVVSEYLYVGSGLIELDEQERAYYVFARRNGQLVIPATSIKGAIRSIVEAISNSCVSQFGRKENVRSKSHQSRECKTPDQFCPACRLFGITGYRGRIHFADATLINEVESKIVKIADLWPPHIAKERKFYQAKTFQSKANQKPEKNHRFLEAVSKGTRLKTTLFFENVSSAEVGLVVRAMGLMPSLKQDNKVVRAFPVKLGGAKPRCLGATYFHPKHIFVLPTSAPGLFQALSTGGQRQETTPRLLEWLADETLLDTIAWERFKKEAKLQPESCPEGMY